VASSRPSAGKRARELARQERAAEKAERRKERSEAAAEATPVENALSEDELMSRLRDLQERLDAGTLDLEAFQSAREELMARFQA
jgi:hypothetical protein